MIEERYLVMAGDGGQAACGDHEREGLAAQALRVFSNPDVARSHAGRRTEARFLRLQEVRLDEFRHILGTARDRGYARVDLDGHAMGLNEFAKLVEHEQLE